MKAIRTRLPQRPGMSWTAYMAVQLNPEAFPLCPCSSEFRSPCTSGRESVLYTRPRPQRSQHRLRKSPCFRPCRTPSCGLTGCKRSGFHRQECDASQSRHSRWKVPRRRQLRYRRAGMRQTRSRWRPRRHWFQVQRFLKLLPAFLHRPAQVLRCFYPSGSRLRYKSGRSRGRNT